VFAHSVFRRVLLSMTCVLAAAPATAQDVRVNVGLGGAEPDGPNGGGVLSGDGRFVAFASRATNLVAGDTNASADVFVRDLAGASTTRVSLAADGLERAGDSGLFPTGSTELDLSDDGRFVVFASRAALGGPDTATCLLPGDTAASNCPDIFVRDRQAGTTTRISLGPGGVEPNGASLQPKISGDGRWVVFTSDASNLVANDTNGVRDVFLFDRQTSTLTRVSHATDGTQADLPSSTPAISDDGTVIGFASASTSLSSEPDPVVCERAPPACERPFVVDRVAGTTRRVPMPDFVTRVDQPPPFAPVTYRIEAVAVGVSPDGSTVFVNAGVYSSVVSITQGFRAASWFFDRVHGHLSGHPGRFANAIGVGAFDGRRVVTNAFFQSSTPSGTSSIGDRITGLVATLASGDSGNLPSGTGLGANGRYVLLEFTDISGIHRDLFVRDLDPDADGMPSYWETFWGLNPAIGTDAAADPDGDGLTNLAEYTSGGHPFGTVFRYLAEGANNSFFTTNISIANPGTVPVTVLLHYQGDNGSTEVVPVGIHARGHRTVSAQPSGAASFSTVIESSAPVTVNRTMTWGNGYGSSAETAQGAPATTWFLAEGATHGSFTLFYLLQNPGTTAAAVEVTYLRPSPAAPVTKSYTIPATSRLTIAVDAIPELAATDVSARIVSDVPILVERSMYMDTLNPPEVFGAGHAGAGLTATNTRWFLAEGATGSFFDLYYLIANPSTQATTARITYLLPTGAPLIKEYPVPAQSRVTISVDGEDARLADTPVSAIVESTTSVGLVVERSMWWPGQGQWTEGHLSAGSTVTARRWALAGGDVGHHFNGSSETYVLIANTGATAGTVTLTELTDVPSATPATRTIAIPANSRVSVPMSQVIVTASPVVGNGFGTLVESDGPEIVVEQAVYSDYAGIVWAAGSDVLGTPLP